MRRLIGLLATLVFVSIAAIAGAATPEEVLDDPGVNENQSSASAGYLVWSANSEARPNHYNTFVRPDAGARVRVNPLGTQSHTATIDGTTIVYEEHDAPGADGDLWRYDAATEVRSAVPSGVNTRNEEYRPSLSGDWLLFTRDNLGRVPIRDAWVKVILFDLTAGTGTLLEKLPARSNFLQSDQVNGDWATFESCRFRRGEFFDCQVYLHDISGGGTTHVPNPGLQQYGGAVSDDGTVYVSRTRNRDHWNCGSHTRIVRMDGGNGTVIATLPDGRDALTMFALDAAGSTTLYFDRLRCRNGRTGIYRIADADTTT